MKKIAVIGSGTAGTLSLAHCLAFFPEEWQVVSIYDPNIPILGIGESTSTQIPLTLFYATGFNFLDYSKELDSTIKHGVKYINWRENDFFTKIPPPYYAMHFNNFSLKEFCFQQFQKKYNNRFSIIEDRIKNVTNLPKKVAVETSKDTYKFDYVIDCRGFPTGSKDHIYVDTIPVNHCLVYTINKPGDWNFTYHQAHQNGWMFGIPLQTRQGWGYLYNDKITTKQEALADLSKIFNANVNLENTREFAFKNYKAKKFLDGRILKNGNMSLFYEPIEALSGWFYDSILRVFFDVVVEKTFTEDQANNYLHNLAEDYEIFICYMYHKGSMFQSKFWDITTQKCQTAIENSEKFRRHVEIMKQVDPALHTNTSLVFPIGVWRDLEANMQNQYF